MKRTLYTVENNYGEFQTCKSLDDLLDEIDNGNIEINNEAAVFEATAIGYITRKAIFTRTDGER